MLFKQNAVQAELEFQQGFNDKSGAREYACSVLNVGTFGKFVFLALRMLSLK